MKFRFAKGLLAVFLVVGGLAGVVTVSVALTDGGCPTLAFRDRLFAATFATDNDGWIVGYPGIVLHTGDGGKSWERACDLSDQALFAVDFVGRDRGWAVGRAGKLIMTHDAGKTWTHHEALCEDPLFDVDFVDEKHGWAVGNFGSVLRTIDGGETWISQVLEPMGNASINAVHFFDAQHGFLVGEYPAWEAVLDENVVVETLSNMFETTDGGMTWKVVDAGTKFALYAINFRDDKHGYAVGTKGTLTHTVDGGATWNVIPTGVEVNLFGLAVSPSAAWAVGTAGTLLKIKEGRVEVVDLNAYSWLSAVAFSPAGNGLIVGGRGLLYHTQSDGQSWDRLQTTH